MTDAQVKSIAKGRQQLLEPGKRKALVERTALIGTTMPSQRRRAYWRGRLSYFRAQLLRYDLDPELTEIELRMFALQVRRAARALELQREMVVR